MDNYGPAEARIIRVPIREDLAVAIFGLPFDMTAEEATKIANVVKAFVNPTQGKP